MTERTTLKNPRASVSFAVEVGTYKTDLIANVYTWPEEALDASRGRSVWGYVSFRYVDDDWQPMPGSGYVSIKGGNMTSAVRQIMNDWAVLALVEYIGDRDLFGVFTDAVLNSQENQLGYADANYRRELDKIEKETATKLTAIAALC